MSFELTHFVTPILLNKKKSGESDLSMCTTVHTLYCECKCVDVHKNECVSAVATLLQIQDNKSPTTKTFTATFRSANVVPLISFLLFYMHCHLDIIRPSITANQFN